MAGGSHTPYACMAHPMCMLAKRTLPALHLTHFPREQMGHQAAQCNSGTVNWRQIYGESEFTLRPPQYWSEELARLKAKTVDAEELEKRARDFAKVRKWPIRGRRTC